MVRIRPFRAIRYDPAKTGDLSLVTSQPYDRIGEALQKTYYDRHPNHIVRIIRGRDEPGDSEARNRYTRARDFLHDWLAEGILVRDEEPALYVYRQRYRLAGREIVRTGLTALVGLEEPGRGAILPHEETHVAPKLDRFRLLAHTGTHFEHIFLLYPDPGRETSSLLESLCRGEPPLRAVDDFGEVHEAWPVRDGGTIRRLSHWFDGVRAIIADGHHRYETAYRFMLEMDRLGATSDSHRNVLATLINLDDPGLTIFPTHRAVRGAPALSALPALLESLFDVETVSGEPEEIEAAIRTPGPPTFGVLLPGTRLIASLRDPAEAVRRMPGDRPQEWKLLDVNVLHGLILGPLLGVTAEDLAHERKVGYFRHAREVAEALRGGYDAGFLVRPCTVAQIRRLAELGERFPQKTTDFYPKLLSGFLMCGLDLPREHLEGLRSRQGENPWTGAC